MPPKNVTKKAVQRVKAETATQAPNPANFSTAKGQLPSYKEGGKVKETGAALLHKGETVVPVSKKRGTSDGHMVGQEIREKRRVGNDMKNK